MNKLKERFDDIEENDEFKEWSRMCKSCVSKLNVSIEMLDEAGQGVYGVRGCEDEADFYIDFE